MGPGSGGGAAGGADRRRNAVQLRRRILHLLLLLRVRRGRRLAREGVAQSVVDRDRLRRLRSSGLLLLLLLSRLHWRRRSLVRLGNVTGRDEDDSTAVVESVLEYVLVVEEVLEAILLDDFAKAGIQLAVRLQDEHLRVHLVTTSPPPRTARASASTAAVAHARRRVVALTSAIRMLRPVLRLVARQRQR
jgi:hypothetical protein